MKHRKERMKGTVQAELENDSVNSKSLSRRRFLLLSAAAGATLFIAGNSITPSISGQSPKQCILVDVSRCIGCMKCVAACKSYHQEYENLSAEGTAYTKVAIVDGTLPIPQLCLHCVDAPCVNTCITHALTQLDNGPVVLDRTKCIGCLICVDQCPFGSITFNPVDRKISKCEMCNQAVQQGKKPYCVRDCPTATLTFGSYDDKLAEGLKLAEQRQGVLLYPGDTNTLYVVSNTDLETFLKHPEVTIIKNKYPTDSRWIADLLKYSRVAWAPVALGAAFYILKWSKIEPGGKNET